MRFTCIFFVVFQVLSFGSFIVHHQHKKRKKEGMKYSGIDSDYYDLFFSITIGNLHE